MVKTYILDVRPLSDGGKFEKYLAAVSDYRRNKVKSLNNKMAACLSLGVGFLMDFALGEYNLHEKDISLCFNEYGKPYISGRDGIFFSLSHSGSLAVCSAADFEVGVDAEKIREFSPSVFSKICTPGEKKYLESLDTDLQKDEFFRLWTARESCVKFLGTGVLAKPVPFEFDFKTPPSFLGENPPFLKEYAADGYKITVCGEKKEFDEMPIWVNV